MRYRSHDGRPIISPIDRQPLALPIDPDDLPFNEKISVLRLIASGDLVPIAAEPVPAEPVIAEPHKAAKSPKSES